MGVDRQAASESRPFFARAATDLAAKADVAHVHGHGCHSVVKVSARKRCPPPGALGASLCRVAAGMRAARRRTQVAMECA